ncbi:hypothetical protein R3P38DRAFT_2485248, partial [Favolaschia claudopus]
RNKIKISRTEKVECVVELSEIPERFPVPAVDTAYILDFSGDERAGKETKGGKLKGFDAFLKEEGHSWGKGSNGSTTRDTNCVVLGGIPTRRSTHKCNGAYKCEFFDPELLNGYERDDGEDMSLTRKIFDLQLTQNRTDSGSAAGKAVSFHRVVQGYKKRGCRKPGCRGHPVLRRLKSGPNADGKTMFVGCSGWTAADSFGHTYAAIPAEVDESIYATYHNGTAVPPSIFEDHDDDTGLCAHLAHPRHGKQPNCHGNVVIASIVPHKCPAVKIVYTSKDPAVKKCVVIFRGRHSHPPWPLKKPGRKAKEDVKKAADANGILGQTGGKLNNGTVSAVGSSISVKHPAYRDARRLRNDVAHLKQEATPAGLLWAGIVADYESDLKLPLPQRYIHHTRTIGETK